ncbi:hypothetical protein D3C81_1012740 [compost metagenome]
MPDTLMVLPEPIKRPVPIAPPIAMSWMCLFFRFLFRDDSSFASSAVSHIVWLLLSCFIALTFILFLLERVWMSLKVGVFPLFYEVRSGALLRANLQFQELPHLDWCVGRQSDWKLKSLDKTSPALSGSQYHGVFNSCSFRTASLQAYSCGVH